MAALATCVGVTIVNRKTSLKVFLSFALSFSVSLEDEKAENDPFKSLVREPKMGKCCRNVFDRNDRR